MKHMMSGKNTRKYTNFSVYFLVIIITLLLFLLINIIIHILPRGNSNDVSKKDRVVDQGSIAFGVYNKSGRIIDNGSSITNVHGHIEHFIEIEQWLPDEREYLLLALVDFNQVPFYVGDQLYDKYKVSLNGNDNARVNISLNIPDSSKELEYIIIKMPDYKIKPKELARANILQEIMSLRFNLNQTQKSIDYEADYQKSSKKPLDNIFISRDESILKVEYVVKSNDLLYLTLGNLKNQEIDYALVAFLDWNQIPINNEMIKFYSIKSKERIYLELKMPNVKKSANYQVFAFPYPYKVKQTNFESSLVYGSHRLYLKPQE